MAVLAFQTATDAELDTIQTFVDSLYEIQTSSGNGRADIRLTFKEFSAHPEKGQIVSFKFDDHLCGYAIVVFFWSNEYRGNVLEIDELFVKPEYRRKKVAKSFFDWLKEEHHSAGWALQVSPDNLTACKFYSKLGFKETPSNYLFKDFIDDDFPRTITKE